MVRILLVARLTKATVMKTGCKIYREYSQSAAFNNPTRMVDVRHSDPSTAKGPRQVILAAEMDGKGRQRDVDLSFQNSIEPPFFPLLLPHWRAKFVSTDL